MTPEQKAAFIMARTASALGQIFALHAENAERHFCGKEPANGRAEYEAIINDHGINHNQVITFFQD